MQEDVVRAMIEISKVKRNLSPINFLVTENLLV